MLLRREGVLPATFRPSRFSREGLRCSNSGHSAQMRTASINDIIISDVDIQFDLECLSCFVVFDLHSPPIVT